VVPFFLPHSDWLFHGESCPRLDVVHPGRAWPSSPSCTWHCSLHYLFLQATPLFPHGVTTPASFVALTVSNSSLSTPALLRTHSFFSLQSTKPTESFSVLSYQLRHDVVCFVILVHVPRWTGKDSAEAECMCLANVAHQSAEKVMVVGAIHSDSLHLHYNRNTAGWLKIKYPTGEYTISPQPVVWFWKFLKLLNPDTSLNLRCYSGVTKKLPCEKLQFS